MKTSELHARRRIAALALAAACFVPFVASAQSTRPSQSDAQPTGKSARVLNEVVVTATRTEQALADLVADVSVIDRNDIEKAGAGNIGDLLTRVPGLQMVRTGGSGATTTLYVRGSETRHTAVFVDGVRIDSQSTGGASWETIPLGLVDRIEIVRGPAAAVYGSDAVAGVVQIFTRRGDGPFTPFAGVGAGTNRTWHVDTGFSGKRGAFDYAVGVQREDSLGFNARPIAGQNPDRDGYHQTSGHARIGYAFSPDNRVEATLLSSFVDAQYDAGLRTDDRSEHELRTAGVNWQNRWTRGYQTRISVSESNDRYLTRPSPYLSETRLRNYLFLNEWHSGNHGFTLGLERKEDFLDNSPIVRDRSQNGVSLGYMLSTGAHTLQANIRQDKDSEFGGQQTGSLAYGLAFAPRWRATASAATAFRVPTLFQRFSQYGVATLQPELSHNVEVGLRYARERTSFNAVAYRNRVDNLVTFTLGAPGCGQTSCYTNTAQAILQGVTLSGDHQFGVSRVRASFDFLDPQDALTGRQLQRRARRYAVLGADTKIAEWTVGGEAQVSSQRFDNAANTALLGGYSLFNLTAQRKLSRNWSLLARLDNVFDRNYTLANGYATPGRIFYTALRWEPR